MTLTDPGRSNIKFLIKEKAPLVVYRVTGSHYLQHLAYHFPAFNLIDCGFDVARNLLIQVCALI
jgi:hypothetical protein